MNNNFFKLAQLCRAKKIVFVPITPVLLYTYLNKHYEGHPIMM
jgi:hypothetical protein